MIRYVSYVFVQMDVRGRVRQGMLQRTVDEETGEISGEMDNVRGEAS